MLMVAERTVKGLISSEDKERIDKMNEELTNVIDEFMRTVGVEAFLLAEKSGKHSLSRHSDSSFSVISCRTKAFT